MPYPFPLSPGKSLIKQKNRLTQDKRSGAVTSSTAAGFTLIELLIVITIIALLAALVGPRLMGGLTKSQVKTTKTQIEMLGSSLDSFRLETFRYPSTEEGLQALLEKPPGLDTWDGPYLKKRRIPKDAWGYELIYQRPATKGGLDYDLYSLGADNKEGGESENADIGNWD